MGEYSREVRVKRFTDTDVSTPHVWEVSLHHDVDFYIQIYINFGIVA